LSHRVKESHCVSSGIKIIDFIYKSYHSKKSAERFKAI
jgi:hypothetical protein